MTYQYKLIVKQDVKKETYKQPKYLHQSTVVGNLKEKIFKKKIYNKDKYLATFPFENCYFPNTKEQF